MVRSQKGGRLAKATPSLKALSMIVICLLTRILVAGAPFSAVLLAQTPLSGEHDPFPFSI